MNEIEINGEVYIKKSEVQNTTPRTGERPMIGIVDNRGLTFVGYTNFEKDENGMIFIREAQCIIRWWTNAHIGYLVNGVCDGVELGAKHDVYVKEFYLWFDLPFDSIESWKVKKVPKGKREVMQWLWRWRWLWLTKHPQTGNRRRRARGRGRSGPAWCHKPGKF